jgi:hypothetical protein
MPNKARGLLGRMPLWIIARYQHNQIYALIVDPDGDGGLLPVFSFEEEAETFLRLFRDHGMKTRWWCRVTTAGELISILLAPCVEVKRVALDPLPLSFGRVMLPLVSVNRERFVQDMLEESRRVSGELEPI